MNPQQLRDDGFVMLEPLSNQQVDDVLTFLKARPVFNGRHVVQADTTGFTSWDEAAGANVLAWTLADAVLAPHLLERALSMTDFAAEYLGVETPLLYSMNVFCTRPGQPVRPDIQDWHRDCDDARFLPMFFYLTDVGPEARQELRVRDGVVAGIEGPRGTVFLSDTMREHRGLKPQRDERIIGWARWGVSDPPESYKWDHLQPTDKALLGDRFPADPRLQRSIHLVAA